LIVAALDFPGVTVHLPVLPSMNAAPMADCPLLLLVCCAATEASPASRGILVALPEAYMFLASLST
jgi:hypothetical protein